MLVKEIALTPSEVDGKLLKLGVSQRFLRASFANVPTGPASEVAGFFTGESQFLWGPAGMGKTYIAAAMMRKMVESSRHRYFECNGAESIQWPVYPTMITVPDLLLEIRESFNGEGRSERELIQTYAHNSILILDDLGVEKPTEWTLQTLYLIIDHRYRAERQTVFTSNLDLAALAERVGDRISSRISEMCKVIHITGRDRRQQGAVK